MTARVRVLEDTGVREAGQAAGLAEQAWRAHARQGSLPADVPCIQCSVASSRRNYSALCRVGAGLYQARLDAQAALARQRADAARPDPNQGLLFDPQRPGG